MVAGLLVILLGAFAIMFVWAPLGVFVWFGLPNEAILFKDGYRHLSAIALAIYYGVNVALLLQLPRTRWKRTLAIAIFGFWIFGLGGFFTAYHAIAASFRG